MSLRSTHPDYDSKVDDWRQMRDTYEGQRTVKDAEFTYLYPTSSMILDGALDNTKSTGYANYTAYKRRAVFPDLVHLAAHTMVGLIMKDSSEYVLPASMEALIESCSKEGWTLEALHRHILLEQLVYGRTGLAIDFSDSNDLPFFVPFQAEHIRNWDYFNVPGDVNNLSLVVTVENTRERGDAAAGTGYEWTLRDRYRAMELDADGTYFTYTVTEGESEDSNNVIPVYPEYRGNTLDFIPFTIIGAQDLAITPGPIPLIGISNAALSIYCGEADFRQTLHMTGQDTLVISGVADGSDDDDDQEQTRVGATAVIELPVDGDAKYIGITGEGLTEQRQALDDDYKRASAEGSRLLENTAAQAESGEALKVRVAAKTTTLNTVAVVGAAGLEAALRQMAIIMGVDPDEVRIEPNTDFVEDTLSGQDIAQMMEAKENGAPISYRTIHENLRDKDWTKYTFEEEMAEISSETQIATQIKEGRAIKADEVTPTPGANEGFGN